MQAGTQYALIARHSSLLLSLWPALVGGLHSRGLSWWSQPSASKGQHSENLGDGVPIVICYLLPEILSCVSCFFSTHQLGHCWFELIAQAFRGDETSNFELVLTSKDTEGWHPALAHFHSFPHVSSHQTQQLPAMVLRKSDPFQNVKQKRHKVDTAVWHAWHAQSAKQCLAFCDNPRDVCSTFRVQEVAFQAKLAMWRVNEQSPTQKAQAVKSPVNLTPVY